MAGQNRVLVVTIKPKRVVKEDGEVSMVEVWDHQHGEAPRLAGFFVYGGRGDSSVLHAQLEDAEAELLRRIEGTVP